MIPAWYAAAGMVTTGLICAVGTHLAGSGRRTRLLKRTTRVVAELRRLTDWTPPAVHWEAGMRGDRWSLPVSPRLTDRPRIAAAKAAAIDLPVVLVPELTAAHRAEPNWYRNEQRHRVWSWGWLVEVVQRLASVGNTFVWEPDEHPLVEVSRGRHVLAPGEVTQEFRRIVAAEFGAQRCDSCTVGRDGEPSHISCVGCSCPCTVVEPLPAGVEGHSIGAGATR